MANTAGRKAPGFVGISPSIREVTVEIEHAARADAKILITGETGVGKEIAARLIHEKSRRATKPLVTINCGGIPDSLLESELFGHVRGSFTGAHRDRSGLLELADGGSIFLDEVGEMSLRLQAAVLRFLETGEIQRVGSDSLHTADVRVIAATNRNLPERIASREFREDLYYRLNVINIVIPPLRQRREDIPLLLREFFEAYAKDHAVQPVELTPETLACLVAYDWPGNTRQLRNVAERIVVRARSPRVTLADLPPEILEPARRTDVSANQDERPVADVLFDRMVEGRESFWMVPYAMFMARDITRDDLRAIIERGLRQTAGSYKDLIKLFNVPPDDYKRLLSFLREQKAHVRFQPFRPPLSPRSRPIRPRASRRREPPPARQRRWSRKEIARVIEAQLATSWGRILDMSYGGLKVAFSGERDVPNEFDVTVPMAGLTVPAHRVWARPAPAVDEFWLGAEVLPEAALSAGPWREFVDSV